MVGIFEFINAVMEPKIHEYYANVSNPVTISEPFYLVYADAIDVLDANGNRVATLYMRRGRFAPIKLPAGYGFRQYSGSTWSQALVIRESKIPAYSDPAGLLKQRMDYLADAEKVVITVDQNSSYDQSSGHYYYEISGDPCTNGCAVIGVYGHTAWAHIHILDPNGNKIMQIQPYADAPVAPGPQQTTFQEGQDALLTNIPVVLPPVGYTLPNGVTVGKILLRAKLFGHTSYDHATFILVPLSSDWHQV